MNSISKKTTEQNFLKTCLTVLILTVFCGTLFGQSDFQTKKDSLIKEIPKQQGKEKLETYNNLCYYCFQTLTDDESLDELFNLLDEFMKEAKRQKNLDLQSRIIMSKTDAFYNLSKRDEMIEYVHENLDFLYENELWNAYYSVYQAMLEAYLLDGKYETAIREAKKLYAFAKEKQHSTGMIATLFTIGNALWMQNRPANAIPYLKQCIEIHKTVKQSYYFANYAYRELCCCLSALKQYEEAKIYLNEWSESLQIQDKTIDKDLLMWSHVYSMYADLYLATNEYDEAERYVNYMDSLTGLNRIQVETDMMRAAILNHRGEYGKALELADRALEAYPDNSLNKTAILWLKSEIFAKQGKAEESYAVAKRAFEIADSIKDVTLNKQLDEFHAIYEVDKHVAEKERSRSYFLFALAGCLLLLIILVIRLYYSRRIARKNRVLVSQIKELQALQAEREKELLNKTGFSEPADSESEENIDGLCPESRKDQLCIAIRDIILKERAYRDPAVTRDNIIARLGTNKELFIDAFQHCFKVSFSEYINMMRLNEAIAMLEQSDLTIENIAEKSGFGTVRTLQRQFHEKFNMSPKQYRKTLKN